MTASDALLTIAELSMALAGFAGVVIGILGTRTIHLERQDVFGFAHILSSSGAALVFSLLPFALHAAGVSESTAWSATTLLLGVIVLVGSVAWGYAARRTSPRHPPVFWAFVSTGVVLGAALISTGSGLLEVRGTLLPLALLWLLLVAFSQFVTFLVVSWSPRG